MAIDAGALVASSAVGSVASRGAEGAQKKMQDMLNGEMPVHGPVELELLVHIASNIEKAILEAKKQLCPPLEETVILPGANMGREFVLNRRGYKHVSILSSAAITVVSSTGLGPMNFNVAKGWSPFDMPDGARLSVTAATDTKVTFYFGDDAVTLAAA